MKTKLIFLALVLAGVANSWARAVVAWPEMKLQSAADLVVLAMPIGSEDLSETNSLGWPSAQPWERFRGVETTFKVLDVLKGMPKNDRIVLHHYRPEWGEPDDGPTFVSFMPGETNKYVMYLAKDGPNRYAPVAGQLDPGLSIERFKKNRDFFGFGFPVLPPAADANPQMRHSVPVHVPVRLHAERSEDAIFIKTDEMMATNLTVGSNVFTGTSAETDIYCGGKRVTGTDSMQSDFTDGSCDETFRRALWGVPKPAEKYTLIVTLTLFETDEPPQHFWDPREGNYYKVLCEQRFKLIVQ